jgi:hypothetical protein
MAAPADLDQYSAHARALLAALDTNWPESKSAQDKKVA